MRRGGTDEQTTSVINHTEKDSYERNDHHPRQRHDPRGFPTRTRGGSPRRQALNSRTRVEPTATYSPDDNKLRISSVSRFDSSTVARLSDAGFRWAPKQLLWVAPMWTPSRADLCEELAGEITDEDTSLVDRAEVRADRFDDYSARRASESQRAADAVRQLADGIPFGQPILIGHHSEARARRDAKRIENGMRRAVDLWDTSEYWKRRAAGAVRAAKYKERPDVRARRMRGLEADARKIEREIDECLSLARLWGKVPRYEYDKQTLVARAIAGRYTFGVASGEARRVVEQQRLRRAHPPQHARRHGVSPRRRRLRGEAAQAVPLARTLRVPPRIRARHACRGWRSRRRT